MIRLVLFLWFYMSVVLYECGVVRLFLYGCKVVRLRFVSNPNHNETSTLISKCIRRVPKECLFYDINKVSLFDVSNICHAEKRHGYHLL